MSKRLTDTCIKKECHLWKKYKDKCPNFFKFGGKDPESLQSYTTYDCSPRRNALMTQEILARFTGLQKANEQARNKTNSFLRLFEPIMTQIEKPMPPMIEE